MLVTNTHIILE